MSQPDRFVRVPTDLLEALLRARLSGTQWGILFWVIRQSYGWNRPGTSFTWYRIAQEMGMNRPAVYRAGQALFAAKILAVCERQLTIQTDLDQWDTNLFRAIASSRQLWIPGITVASKQRPALPRNNGDVAGAQRNRCQEATLFRRAKDSSKDNIETKRKTGPLLDVARQQYQNGAFSERRHPAGAARPIPGKYDGLSQDR
jgi:phage replication O-like protein O